MLLAVYNAAMDQISVHIQTDIAQSLILVNLIFHLKNNFPPSQFAPVACFGAAAFCGREKN